MISDNGLQLIKHFEGCRLKSYQDTAGIWTIGYGHTKHVQPNQTITQDEADKLLKADSLIAEIRVAKCVEISKMEQCKIDALISQAFNLRSFEKLAGYLPNEGLYLFKTLLYCKDVAGHELLGLKRRRLAEVMLFLNQSWEQIKIFMN